MKIGIVGLPNVGKSTLFQAITKKKVDISNYPFCTIDPNIGIVTVADERVDKLAEISKSVKKVYAVIEFVDIAGIVEGANKGEGLGNKFLANIRETDAIVYILRAFLNTKIINTRTKIDPVADKEILETELMLKDLETVNKRITGLERDVRGGTKEAIKEMAVLQKTKNSLEEGNALYKKILADEERETLKGLQLLTLKPCLYILNGPEQEISESVKETFKKNNWPYLILDILAEFETAGFNKQERETIGMPGESALDSLIKEAYKLLDLITFLTTGPDETRAWTVKRNSTAPRAGAAIHTDFEENFIKAEVINWGSLLEAGGCIKAREKGLLRTEGKKYIVQDGDVIEFKI